MPESLYETESLSLITSKYLQKEREKLGHVWLNTMFICPQFCGGAYVHGDEAYPYPKGGSMHLFAFEITPYL